MNTSTAVAVLGLGRLGSAVAARLARTHPVRTWTRSDPGGRTPAQAVAGVDVVLLCVYDAAACREVLEQCGSGLAPGCTVVNTATVGPEEAVELAELVAGCGARYVHAPVLGSVPAALEGRLTVLVGATVEGSAGEVLEELGRSVRLAGPGEAAAAKLLANGVLADALLTLRRALQRADQLRLPRATALDVLECTLLAPLVSAKRDLLERPAEDADEAAQFTVGALAKDLALLGRATGSLPAAASDLDVLLSAGGLRVDDDVAALAAVAATEPGLATAFARARLDLAPGVVVAPDVARPLLAYALGHATGDPAHFRDAFLPTAHVEGYRDGAFTSWCLDDYGALFPGHPPEDEPTRRRRLERVDVCGDVGTARMSLHHGADAFTDSFVLLRSPEGEWRIANKVYARRAQARPGTSTPPV